MNTVLTVIEDSQGNVTAFDAGAYRVELSKGAQMKRSAFNANESGILASYGLALTAEQVAEASAGASDSKS